MTRKTAAFASCLIAWNVGCAASHTREAADGGAWCEILPQDPDGNATECASARAEGRSDLGACARHADWLSRGQRCAESGAPPESCGDDDRTAYVERVDAARMQCRPSPALGGLVWEEARYWRQERWIWVGSLDTGHWDYALSPPAILEHSPRESGCVHGRNAGGGCCNEGCVCGASCIVCQENCTIPGVLTGSSSRTIARADQLPCGHDGYEPFQATGPFVCAEEISILGCDCPPDLSGRCGDTLVAGASVYPRGLNTTCDGPRPSALPAFITRDIELTAVLHVLTCCARE